MNMADFMSAKKSYSKMSGEDAEDDDEAEPEKEVFKGYNDPYTWEVVNFDMEDWNKYQSIASKFYLINDGSEKA
jgi:hypothetical protein